LKEYNRRSDGMVNFEFIDPNSNVELEQEAAQNGIQPLLINVREKNEVIQKRAFMGAVLKSGDQQEVLPFIEPEGPMEYQLTKAIKKLSKNVKPAIGLLSGHDESNAQNLAEVLQELSVLYTIETLDLNSIPEIPIKYKAVLMVNPQDSIPYTHFQILDDYLSKGGNICLATNTIIGDFQTAQGKEINTMIPEWLSNKGIVLKKDFVLDAQCGSIGVKQQQGLFSFQSQVQFPYFPRIINFNDHPITEGIEQLILPIVSSIENSGNLKMTPLIYSSGSTLSESAPLIFDIQRKWRQSDFPEGQKVLASIFEGVEENGKLILFADGDFPNSQGGNTRSNADNFSLLVNSVDWLSDDTGLIDLRTKGVSSRPIKTLEESEISFYKWINFLLPILLVLALGLFIHSRNRSIRTQRMNSDFS